ncbi:MAG: hypothetical protein ACO396_03995 [Phycisphaerales bacterium]
MPSIANLLFRNPPSVASRYLYKRTQIALSRVSRERPVVTYATYRTASTSVHRAIRGTGVKFAVKAHTLALEHLLSRKRERSLGTIAPSGVPMGFHVGDWVVRHGILEAGREADFVITIRDPVAVATSNFASSPHWWTPSLRTLAKRPENLAGDEALARAVESLSGGVPTLLMRDWLSHDAGPTLRFDPFTVLFDAERGWTAIESGPWRVLLLRADLTDERKRDAVEAFLGRRIKAVARRNETERASSVPREVIELGRRAIASTPALLDRLLDPTFVGRFWTIDEIDRLREKWGGGVATAHAR